MVLRFFIEKKRGYDIEAAKIRRMLGSYIQLGKDCEIRVFTRYDINDVDPSLTPIIRDNILSDFATDNVYCDFLPLTNEWHTVAIADKDGLFSYKKRYVAENMRLISERELTIDTAMVIGIYGIGDKATRDKITKLLCEESLYINVSAEKPITPKKDKKEEPKDNEAKPFTKKNDIEIYQYVKEKGLSMSSAELCYVRDKYKAEGVEPTDFEIALIDSCVGKFSCTKTVLENFEIDDGPLGVPVKIALDEYYTIKEELSNEKGVTLRGITETGIAALQSRGLTRDLIRDGDGYAVQIAADDNGVTDQWIVRLKNKINQGSGFRADTAADVLCESRVSDYQNIHIFNDYRSDDNDTRLVSGKETMLLREADIRAEQCAFSGETVNDARMLDTGLKEFAEFTASLGAAPKWSQSRAAVSLDDRIFVLGGKYSIYDCAPNGVYQQKNPELKKAMKRFFADFNAVSVIKKCVSFDKGAAGALYSIANGVEIDADSMIYGNENIKLLCSPCYRVAVVIDPQNSEKLYAAAAAAGLSLCGAGVVNESGKFAVSLGKDRYEFEYGFINSVRTAETSDVHISFSGSDEKLSFYIPSELTSMSVSEAFLANLTRKNVASQRGFTTQFDNTGGSKSVVMPFGGKMGMSPESAAVSKLPVSGGNTNTVTAMSFASEPRFTGISAYHGAAFSVMECISKIVATGGNSLDVKLGISQYMSEPGNIPSKWGQSASAQLGFFSAEIGMGVPIVSNEFYTVESSNYSYPYGFVCNAFVTAKINNIIPSAFEQAGSTVLLIPMPVIAKTGMPDFEKAKVMYRQLHYLSQSNKVLSSCAVGAGGVAATVAEMSFGNRLCVNFDVTDKSILFGDRTASIIVETQNPGAFSGMNTIILGKTGFGEKFTFGNETVTLKEALKKYDSRSQSEYQVSANIKVPVANIKPYSKKKSPPPEIRVAKPRVLIPVFPGFFGENEAKMNFSAYGAECDILYVDAKNPKELCIELIKRIRKSQIIMLPGGCEYTPCENLVLNILRSGAVSEAVMKFIDGRGLILGTGSAQGILLKSGLVTKGKFKASDSDTPYLAPNTLLRPVSQSARMRVISVKSPWMSCRSVGDTYSAPVIGSNMRLIMDEQTVISLAESGQIVTQYAKPDGNISAKLPYNPFGSSYAVESICSPDGRILASAAKIERCISGCYANVPGSRNSHIFESGVKYFS